MRDKITGFLDIVTAEKSSGWALKKGEDQPLMVYLFIDGKLCQKVKATRFRPDLLEKKVHPTGKCGYKFDMKGMPINSACSIQVFAGDAQKELINSPWHFEPDPADIEPDKKQVLISGLPQCGTDFFTAHLTEGLGNFYTHNEPIANKDQEHFSYYNTLIERHPFLLAEHLLRNNSKTNEFLKVASLFRKKIWCIRDPRDLFIIKFFHKWLFTDRSQSDVYKTALGKLKRKINNPNNVPFLNITRGIINPGRFVENTQKELDRVWSFVQNEWLLVKYEDLIKGKKSYLENYMGLDLDLSSDVFLKQQEQDFFPKTDYWRHWFTKKDVETLTPLFKPILKKWGYPINDWNLHNEKRVSIPNHSIFKDQLYQPLSVSFTSKLKMKSEVPFFIFFPERSGSSHLVNLLNSHPQINCFGEEFHLRDLPGTQERIPKHNSAASVVNSLRKIYQNEYTKANGFKFKYPGQPERYPEVMNFLTEHSDQVRIIILYRENRLKAAISKQNHTRLYERTYLHNLSKDNYFELGKLTLNVRQAIGYMNDRKEQDDKYLQFTKNFKHSMVITYEEVLSNERQALKEIFSFLSVDESHLPNASTVKITKDNIKEALTNYDELYQALKGTDNEHYLYP